MPRLPPVPVLCGLDGDGALPFAGLLAEGRDVEPVAELGDDDVAALAFTSGTTGLPEAVLQPHRMLKSLAINMLIDYEIMPEEFRYTASQIFHIAGQAMIFMHVVRGFPGSPTAVTRACGRLFTAPSR